MSTSSTSVPNPPNSGKGDREGRGSEAPAIVRSSGEENILAKGRLLYPERGPSRFAVRMARAALEEGRAAGPGRLFLVASPALWYGVAELLAGLPSDAAILCAETDPGLVAIAMEKMPPSLRADPRLRFAGGKDLRSWIDATMTMGRFRRCLPVRLSGGADLDPEAYRAAASALDESFSAYWRNRASLAAMGRLWVRNIFRNLARLGDISPRSPAALLGPAALSGPAVICGAGPSLEGAIPLIRRHRNKVLVVAADTAAGPLAMSGIVPDLVICLEAQIWNLRDFLPLEGAAFTLLGDLSSHPSSFGLRGAVNSLSCVRIAEGAFMGRLRALGLPLLDLPPLGSVGVEAIHVAARLGAAPLFVAGLDFAFETGKTHARGSPTLAADLHSSTRLSPVGSPGLTATFREGVRPTTKGLGLTDPILTRYAALAVEELALSGRPVFDLRGGFGQPLGALVPTLDQAERLLAELPEREGAPKAPVVSEDGEAILIATDFLKRELGRLLELEGLLRRGEVQGGKKLPEALAELDYVLWPMPDADRVASLPQDLLNRVLVETEYWIAELGELISASP